MKRGAIGFQEIPVATEAHQLPPLAAVGVAMSAEISPIHPAAIGAVRLWAEAAGSIDCTATASGKAHTGWRFIGPLSRRFNALLTEFALWFASISGKRLGFPF